MPMRLLFTGKVTKLKASVRVSFTLYSATPELHGGIERAEARCMSQVTGKINSLSSMASKP